MSIQNINGQNLYNTVKTNWNTKSAAAENTKEAAVENGEKAAQEESKPVRQDQFEYTQPQKPVTYGKKLSAAQLQSAETQRMESFQQMLKSMIVKQGEKSNLTLFGMDLNVTPADSQRAAAAIAEGGEYSVDAVATRILDMAKALSGGDMSKLSELRSAVEKGFKAAGMEMGGKLPSICNDTYNEVMKRFDEWEKEGKAGATVTE